MTNTAEPPVHNTVQPLIITKNAKGLITFIETVFNAVEFKAARTLDEDGLLLHSEFEIGNSKIVVIDAKEGWPFTPSFLWLFVDDVDATLKAAKKLGATVITEPTAFYGDIFSRVKDPWGNLWWVYQHGEHAVWDDVTEEGDETWSSEPDAETMKDLSYIYDTWIAAMGTLGT